MIAFLKKFRLVTRPFVSNLQTAGGPTATRPGRHATALALALVVFTGFCSHASAQVRADLKEPGHATRLSSTLLDVVHSSDPLFAAQEKGIEVRHGQVRVINLVEPGSEDFVREEIAHYGGTVNPHRAGYISAYLPPDAVEELASITGVARVLGSITAIPIRLPMARPPQNSAEAEVASSTLDSATAINAPAWHSAGFRGQGAKVGIITSGFAGYESLLGTELPPSNRLRIQAFGASIPSPTLKYATTMAEIIYDLAPDAEIWVAIVDYPSDDFNAGLAWLESNGVKTILTTWSWQFSGPGDGTGSIQDTLEESSAQYGTLWVIGAGDARKQHWQGQSFDQDADDLVDLPAEGMGLYFTDCTDGSRHLFSVGEEIRANLTWNDWSYGYSDFGLVVGRRDPATGAITPKYVEDRSNSGYNSPTEHLAYTVDEAGYYGIGILSDYGELRDLELFTSWSNYCLESGIELGSIDQPADSPLALAVGALNSDPPYALWRHSSKGPNNGSGGKLSGGSTKPDIASFASTYSFSAGGNWTGGTRFASAYVGGAAALVWSAYPDYTYTQVRQFLESRAIDMGPAGKDTDYGSGRLYLGNPPQQQCSYYLSPNGSNFDAAGGSRTFEVSTTSSCSWTASSNASWISITSGGSGTGNGTVTYRVETNPTTSSRNGSITAGGVQFSILQVGAVSCSFSLMPSSATVGSSGGNGTISVSASTGACSWAASSNAGWLHITAGGGGTGSGSMSYAVDANTGAQRTGTFTIAGLTFTVNQAEGSGGGGAFKYFVAGVAHAGGVGNSTWRSSVSVVNLSSTPAHITMIYRSSAGAFTRTQTLPIKAIHEWDDVASSLFGIQAATSGALEIDSDVPVHVSARTYNQTASGSYGQFLPGCRLSDSLGYGQVGVLPQIKKTASFRSNIGYVNLGSSSCDLSISLYSKSGSQIGNAIQRSVGPGQWKQDSDIFATVGASSCDLGYAVVEVRTPGCSLWVYASVVDNGSGDPTTIPVMVN